MPVKRMTRLAPALMMLALGACGQLLPSDSSPPKQETAAPQAGGMVLAEVALGDLPGWLEGEQQGVWRALRRSCAKILLLDPAREIGSPAIAMKAGDWTDICQDVARAAEPDTKTVRAFLQGRFNAYAVSGVDGDDEGLFTGYFEAELEGSRERAAGYEHPLYARPDDLVSVNLGRFSKDLKGRHVVGQAKDGKVRPYPARGEIEAGLLADKGLELAWAADPVDVFLLQVQGSGRLKLPDGSVMRVGFAGHNGQPYKSIGRHLIDKGELKPHEASWDGIRNWLEGNPDKVRELFAVNPRFVFFRELKGDGPIGSQGVALTAGRSLAVDKRFIPMGVPVWLDSVWPSQHDRPLRRLMVAQDTGGAIKGVVRGDFFWGYGDEALAFAGKMKSPGRYYLILPKTIEMEGKYSGS